jgi:hypothetical protein
LEELQAYTLQVGGSIPSSITILEEKKMNFAEAVMAANFGDSIRRTPFPHSRFVVNEFEITNLPTNTLWYLADDWEVVQKGHDFKWALEQLKAGKYVTRRSIEAETGKIRGVGPGTLRRLQDGTLQFKLEEIEATDWILVDR